MSEITTGEFLRRRVQAKRMHETVEWPGPPSSLVAQMKAVLDAIRELSGDPVQIRAKILAESPVWGVPGLSDSCPVACYVKAKTGVAVNVQPESVHLGGLRCDEDFAAQVLGMPETDEEMEIFDAWCWALEDAEHLSEDVRSFIAAVDEGELTP